MWPFNNKLGLSIPVTLMGVYETCILHRCSLAAGDVLSCVVFWFYVAVYSFKED